MKFAKKSVSYILAILLMYSVSVVPVFAANETTPQVATEEAQNATEIQSMPSTSYSAMDTQKFDNLDEISPNEAKKISTDSPQRRTVEPQSVWGISDPVFVGDGTLSESFDIYVVSLTAKQLSFLKLDSSNSNLLAVLYNVNANGSLGSSTGWGVKANGGHSYINIPAGKYAIVIGSATGNERGNYKLMWNASNPSGASAIINCTADLSRVVLYYNLSTIRSNGDNILTGLKWENHETWYTSNGYSARDMSMTVAEVKGVYLGSFSSSAPYSAPNALLIDISKGSWLYSNSYYRNVEGDVTHIMDYTDPSGLKTPRTFGTGHADFSYGPNYIVIDLDKFQVCEFLSPFNYFYTTSGGRTYSLNNLQKIS
ncbi:hypothetical protein P4H61_02435 [Paenibacillus peoriae]|uniref:hypothetical protein n=1 Tax=Paenibacillus peoriae TaxID=59893 RepID=UPI00026C6101|nr:hypothetical protein [Paenibacillus peoriae]MEC0180358.1 hypothetical protein [Paenibacillus peoriae]